PLPIRHAGDLVPFDLDEPLRRESEAFLEAAASRQPPLTDGESGLRVLGVLEAAQSSLAREGVPVLLNPASERSQP
ncbi:MAG: gfo/Idh/MocA family oxidoreductase, partial [Thermoanaerobaculia bacterium]